MNDWYATRCPVCDGVQLAVRRTQTTAARELGLAVLAGWCVLPADRLPGKRELGHEVGCERAKSKRKQLTENSRVG